MIRIWGFITIVLTVSIYYLREFGVINAIHEGDNTRISFGMIGIFLLWFAYTGYNLVKSQHKYESLGEELIEKFPQIGLFGTVLGFIFMLDNFKNADFSDTASIQELMGQFASGFATALYTTAVGILLSITVDMILKLLAKYKGESNE